MSVSFFAIRHRATWPDDGMERVRWNFARMRDHLPTDNISFDLSSPDSPKLNRPYHSPVFLEVGVLHGTENMDLKGRNSNEIERD